MVEKPKPFVEELRKGINLKKYGEFWHNCDFKTLFELQRPTPDKVVNCFTTNENLTNEQEKVLHYLEMFVRCLDDETLSKFLFFITGSHQMPPHIKIEFNCLSGLSRIPKVSTCTNTLQLSVNYHSCQDLKKELITYIQAEDTYRYSEA